MSSDIDLTTKENRGVGGANMTKVVEMTRKVGIVLSISTLSAADTTMRITVEGTVSRLTKKY
jgi:hypothetical protein